MTKFVRTGLPLAVIFAASLLAGCEKQESVGEEESAALIAPVAKVEVAGASSVTTATLLGGDEVVKQYCAACHVSGAAGAPKLGDRGAWAPRIAQGYETLLAAALNGKGAMPAKGGAANLQDVEVARAVVAMANGAGANFTPPPAPAAPPPMPTAAQTGAPAGTAPGLAAVDASAAGKKVYETGCVACHATGAANAPRAGDKAQWAARIAQGMPALYNSALNGKGAMPAKGGNMSLSEADVKAATDYLVSLAK